MYLHSVLLASAPWWVFLMMPLMMLGMGLMMWLMMRMMMGMDHGSHQGSADHSGGQPTAESESELEALRRQVAELQDRLAEVETNSGNQAPRPNEGEER